MVSRNQVSMFCRECKSLAYGARCHICGGGAEPLDSTIPRDLVRQQSDRLKRIRQIDGWCVTAMLLALTTIGLVAAGMRVGRRSLIPTMIVFLCFGAAQLMGAEFKADWRRITTALALIVACGILIWLPGILIFAVFAPVIVVLLWFFMWQAQARDRASNNKSCSTLQPAKVGFGPWLKRVRNAKQQASSSWSPDDIASAVRTGVVMVTAVATAALILSCKIYR